MGLGSPGGNGGGFGGGSGGGFDGNGGGYGDGFPDGGFGGGNGAGGFGGGFAGGSFGGGGGGGLGGAVFNDGGDVTVSGSTLSGNTAQAGLGLEVDRDGNAYGGAIFNRNGSLTISSSTLAGNTLTGAGDGGAVFHLGDGAEATATITNSIFADSTGGNDFEGATIVGGTSTIVGSGNLVESSQNIPNDVIAIADDPQLGPLAFNGGLTATHALLENSPAIDAGDNSLLPADSLDLDGDSDTVEPIPFDQRGLGRVVDLPGIANATAGVDNAGLDIGAFELTDTSPPVVTSPGNLNIEGNATGGATQESVFNAISTVLSVTDDLNPSPTITSDAPAFVPIGQTIDVTITVNDGFNEATITTSVTVEDTTAPTIMAPSTLTIDSDGTAGASSSGVGFADVIAMLMVSDIVDDDLVITNDAPTVLPFGDTIVTFTATDDSGNSANALTTVTVIDATAPTITAPADVSVEGDTAGGADPSGAALAAFLAGAVGSDVVDDTVTITDDAPALFPVGETIVTFTATDDAGNTATADATVTVTDTIGPMLTVPNDSTIEGDIVGGASSTGTAFLAFEAMAPATDIVDGTVTVTHDAPAVLPVGATEVTFTATDAAGNTSTATATVTVEFVSDFGDAPAAADSGFANDYPVTRAQDGARHIVGDLFLGSFVDAEGDGQPDAQAGSSGGDDGNGVADEDGVVQVAQLISTVDDATVSSFLITASGTGRVDAWIDFNRDGDWDDANEQIATSVDVNAGSNLLSFAIPAGANIGDTAARFRLSSSGGLLPTGPAADGEVEDYWLSILDGNASPDVTVNDPEAIASLVLEDNQVVVRGSSEILFSVPLESVGVLNVDGQSDDDTITLDFSGGSVILEGGLNLDGAAGDNTLVLAGGDSDFSFAEATFQASNFSLIDLGDENANVITVDAASVSALSTAGPITIRGGDGDTIRFADSDDWRYDDPIEVDGRFTHQIANIVSDQVLQVDLANVWQNVTNPSDTNGDGNVTAGDALLVINELANNRFSDAETQELVDPTVQEWPGFFYDQNGDNRASALDALRIINFLDRQNLGEGEAESEAIVSSFLSATTSDAPASGLIDANATVVNEQPVLDAVFGSFAEASGVQQVSLSTPLSITQRSTSTSAVDELLSDASFFDHLEAE